MKVDPPCDGEHRVLFADGTLSGLEHYVDGLKSGPCEYRYKNGQKKSEGQFASGTFTGEWIWKHYAKDGSLRKTEKHPDRRKG